VLISAVAFDLVEEADDTETGHWAVVTGIFAGCGVFFGGDWLIDRLGAQIGRTPAATRRAARRLRSCSAPCSTGSRSRW
jgi:hypothetical protein